MTSHVLFTPPVPLELHDDCPAYVDPGTLFCFSASRVLAAPSSPYSLSGEALQQLIEAKTARRGPEALVLFQMRSAMPGTDWQFENPAVMVKSVAQWARTANRSIDVEFSIVEPLPIKRPAIQSEPVFASRLLKERKALLQQKLIPDHEFREGEQQLFRLYDVIQKIEQKPRIKDGAQLEPGPLARCLKDLKLAEGLYQCMLANDEQYQNELTTIDEVIDQLSHTTAG